MVGIGYMGSVMRGAGAARRDFQDWRNTVADLQEADRALYNQQVEAKAAGLQVKAPVVPYLDSADVDFGVGVRPIEQLPQPGGNVAATALQTRHVPIPRPRPPDGREYLPPREDNLFYTDGIHQPVGSADDIGRADIRTITTESPQAGISVPNARPTSAGVRTASIGGTNIDGVWPALTKQESSNNPNAVSPAGAVGYAQIMPETAMDPGDGMPNIQQLAVQMGMSPDDPRLQDVDALLRIQSLNEAFGKMYLGNMLKKFNGDMEAALVAYNGGPGVAQKWLEAGKDDSVIPAETRDYYKKIMANSGVASKRTPSWAKDLRPAEDYSMEIRNTRRTRQVMRQELQLQADQLATKRARLDPQIAAASRSGDVVRLRRLMDENDAVTAEASQVRLKALADDQQLAAIDQRLTVDFSLAQMAAGNINPVEQVFEQLTGTPVRLQLRSDGNVTMYYNRGGQPHSLTMSQSELAKNLKQSAFAGERATAAAASVASGSVQEKTKMEIIKEMYKQKGETLGKIAEERAKRDYGTPQTLDDGSIWLPPAQQGGAGLHFMPEEAVPGLGITRKNVVRELTVAPTGAGLSTGSR